MNKPPGVCCSAPLFVPAVGRPVLAKRSSLPCRATRGARWILSCRVDWPLTMFNDGLRTSHTGCDLYAVRQPLRVEHGMVNGEPMHPEKFDHRVFVAAWAPGLRGGRGCRIRRPQRRARPARTLASPHRPARRRFSRQRGVLARTWGLTRYGKCRPTATPRHLTLPTITDRAGQQSVTGGWPDPAAGNWRVSSMWPSSTKPTSSGRLSGSRSVRPVRLSARAVPSTAGRRSRMHRWVRDSRGTARRTSSHVLYTAGRYAVLVDLVSAGRGACHLASYMPSAISRQFGGEDVSRGCLSVTDGQGAPGVREARSAGRYRGHADCGGRPLR
jgi:hypothetical protein